MTAAIDRAEARWAADLATARAVAAAAVEARDAVAAWGLVVGGADDALDAPPVGAPPTLSLGGRALEAWALGAGCKRVAFVTVAPDDEAAVAAQFVGCHVERRTRAVAIGPGDRWCDDRQRGAPRVELYAAVDASDARRAAALQADDPTRHAAALGELFGYPPCCVAAFVAQRSRADNSLNRYLIAARTGAARGPWPWCLNEVHHRLVAFYPCRYDCAAARAVAEATLAAIDAARPGFAATAAALLGRTVLYLDHDHQLWLRGDASGYAGVDVVGDRARLGGLAAALAAGDAATWDDDALVVTKRGAPRARLARREPRLGLWLRFG